MDFSNFFVWWGVMCFSFERAITHCLNPNILEIRIEWVSVHVPIADARSIFRSRSNARHLKDTCDTAEKIHHQQLHSTGFLEPLRFEKRFIAHTKGDSFNFYLLKNQETSLIVSGEFPAWSTDRILRISADFAWLELIISIRPHQKQSINQRK